MADVLFLCASREGQTRRICECMAEALQATGASTQLLALDDPRAAAALHACKRVMIGASIHYGNLPPLVYQFTAQYQAQLDARPNAFFCVNLTARKPGKDTPQGSAYMRRFLKKSAWHPAKLTVFAGALFYTRYTWYDRMMIRFIMWITGGPTDPKTDVEFTDWDKVRSFVREWMAQ